MELAVICEKLDGLALQIYHPHLQVAPADLPPEQPPCSSQPMLSTLREEAEQSSHKEKLDRANSNHSQNLSDHSNTPTGVARPRN